MITFNSILEIFSKKMKVIGAHSTFHLLEEGISYRSGPRFGDELDQEEMFGKPDLASHCLCWAKTNIHHGTSLCRPALCPLPEWGLWHHTGDWRRLPLRRWLISSSGRLPARCVRNSVLFPSYLSVHNCPEDKMKRDVGCPHLNLFRLWHMFCWMRSYRNWKSLRV